MQQVSPKHPLPIYMVNNPLISEYHNIRLRTPYGPNISNET